MRAAVGVEQHRQRLPAVVHRASRGQDERRAQGAFAHRQPHRAGFQAGVHRVRHDVGDVVAVAQHRHLRAAVGQAPRREHGHLRRARPDVHAIHSGQTFHPAAVGAVDVDLGGVVLGGGEQHLVAHMEHGAHLQPRRGHRLAVHEHAVGVVAHAHVHELAVGGPRGNARDDLDPPLVGLAVQQPRRAVAGIDRVDVDAPLVTGRHRDERVASGGPVHGHQVLPVPSFHVHPAAVEAEERQRHRRVGGARGGVGHGGGGGVRVSGVGDGPHRNLGPVGALHQQASPVGGPPVAARPVQLLGGDELGEPPRDVGSLVGHEGSVLPRGELDHTQPTFADVGDVGSGWVRPRVHHGGVHQQPDLTAVEVGRVELAGQREGHQAERLVGGVADHSPGGLPRALAAGTLLGGQVLLARHQRGGVHHRGLLAGTQVEAEQAVAPVGRRPRPQEQQSGTVTGEAEVLRRPQREALGPGLSTQE